MSPPPTAVRRPLSGPHLVLGAVVVVALVVRWQVVGVQSGDYRAFLLPWYEQLASGGFGALAESFSNYNTPYLVLLWLLTQLPLDPLLAIKALSVIFDLLLAFLVHRLVTVLRPGRPWLAVLAATAVLLAPTVVLNSSAWAQCDAIYVACCLGSLYFLLRQRPWLASTLFGLAFAFKLQAIFFLPVLVLLLVLNRHPLRTLLAAPAAFVGALVPALLAGRSLLSQLSVYPAQITNSSGAAAAGTRPAGRPGGFGGGGRGGGFGGGAASDPVSSFTHNAPTPYAWLPADAGSLWKYLGLALALAVALGFGIWILRRRRPLSGGEMLLVAATATLVVPLLLPEMHERYFYVAEVLAVVVAVAVDRRFVAVALLMQLSSTSTYLGYLAGDPLVPLGVASMLALGAAVVAAAVLVTRLRARPGGPGRAWVAAPAAPAPASASGGRLGS
ncbi:MAG: glycosyltransferase 87 family protein [Friedmanniella sp.]